MHPLIQSKQATPAFLVGLLLACFALLPKAQAVSPPPDGGYPGANTAARQSALLSLTTGTYNTAVGILSLQSDTTGSYNTAVGAGALVANTADQNTATGFGALLSNTTGGINTANGAFALFSNTFGFDNTASGYSALFSNTTGGSNTANGIVALVSNTTGGLNTATGLAALASNTTGSDNTANGEGSLQNNTTGASNTALGNFAGSNVTTANNVICIGANVAGNNVDNSCYIGNIFGATSSNGIGVLVNSNGRLGTTTSSRRFKEGIKPMNQASEALFSLKPVTFRYKKEIDPAGTSQFGLVAEDVEKVSPDLVVRDKERKPYSVRYDLVNAMLLNEFLKEHKIVEELKSTVQKQEAVIAEQQQSLESKLAEQEKRVEALTSGLQRVSAQLEVSRSTSQMAWLPVVALGEGGGNQ
jgi:trimeric autotransporter adhesin